jgi:hypothetical protein
VLSSDLEITTSDLSFYPGSEVGESQEVTINITVHNVGRVDASNVELGLFEGDPENSGVRISTVSGTDIIISKIFWNSSEYITTSFDRPAGRHDIYVKIDVDNNTYEMDESNNIAYKTLKINYAPKLDNLDDVVLNEDENKFKVLDLHSPEYIYDHDNITPELKFSVKSIKPSGNITAVITDNRYVNLYPADNWSTTSPVLINIEVTDGFSKDTASFNVTVMPVDDMPYIDPLDKLTVKSNERLSFTINATDSDGDLLIYEDDSEHFDINIYTGEINFTANDTMVGKHDVTVTVSDGELTTSIIFTLEILPRENNPPVLDHISDIVATVDKPYRLIMHATDPDGDPLNFYMSPPLFEIYRLSDTSAEMSFTPNVNDVGDQEVFIIVSDGVETDEQKVKITIKKETKDDDGVFSLSSGALIGLALAVVVILIVIILLFLFFRRRSQSDRDMKAWESMDKDGDQLDGASKEKRGAGAPGKRSVIEDELLGKDKEPGRSTEGPEDGDALYGQDELGQGPGLRPIKQIKIIKKTRIAKQLPPPPPPEY